MKTNKDRQLPQDQDRHLDMPSDANRDKHINFRENEAGNAPAPEGDDATRERQRRWRKGLEGGINSLRNE